MIAVSFSLALTLIAVMCVNVKSSVVSMQQKKTLPGTHLFLSDFL